MELTQLALLLDVVRLGSFAAAAREHRRTPSSVSRAVAGIEGELGFRVLQRTTRQLTPTEAGERYLDRIRPLVAGLDDAAHYARDAAAAPSGLVRATVPVSFALCRLVPLLPALREHAPHVELELSMTDTRQDLIDRRLDFAIRLGTLTDPDLVVRRLFRMRYRVVAAPAWVAQHGAPSMPLELADVDTLVFPLPGAEPVWRFQGRRGPADVAVRPALQATNTLLLREAAIRGLGVTVLPEWLIDDAVADGRLAVLLDDVEVTLTTFDASVWLALPSRRYVPERVRVVTDFLVERLGRVTR